MASEMTDREQFIELRTMFKEHIRVCTEMTRTNKDDHEKIRIDVASIRTEFVKGITTISNRLWMMMTSVVATAAGIAIKLTWFVG